MVGQCRRLADPICHRVNTRLCQCEPVEHDIGDASPCSVHILLVFAQNVSLICFKTFCHGEQQTIFFLCICAADAAPGSLRLFQ